MSGVIFRPRQLSAPRLSPLFFDAHPSFIVLIFELMGQRYDVVCILLFPGRSFRNIVIRLLSDYVLVLSRVLYWMASPMWRDFILSAPSRSAMVLAILRILS